MALRLAGRSGAPDSSAVQTGRLSRKKKQFAPRKFLRRAFAKDVRIPKGQGEHWAGDPGWEEKKALAIRNWKTLGGLLGELFPSLGAVAMFVWHCGLPAETLPFRPIGLAQLYAPRSLCSRSLCS